MDHLYNLANLLPSQGGRTLGRLLQEAARDAPTQTSIVEIGSWLGAGTAQLALGVRQRQQRQDDVRIHTYDRWHVHHTEIVKAAQGGWHLKAGQDSLPRVRKVLDEFAVPISYHKGDLLEAKWLGGPISVYVDDAAKKPRLFSHMLKTFAPHWVPGETVIFLMDFEYWKKSGHAHHQYQRRFIEAHPHAFDRLHGESAVFLYTEQTDFGPWIRRSIPWIDQFALWRRSAFASLAPIASHDAALLATYSGMV